MGELNQGQLRASQCGGGAHLVLAGPGTGKTTTLTARFAHLVSQGIDPRRILAVTFTRKAGEEMMTRLGQLMNFDARSLHVGTFHSLGGKVVRAFAPFVQLTERFRILDERGQRGLLQKLGIFWNPEYGGELTDIFAAAKARMMDADAFREHVEEQHREGKISANDPILEAVDHYHDYQKALLEEDCCDFEDLIMYSVRILEGQEEALSRVASSYDHILVDEFQDVNEGQFRLLRALIQPHGNLWCVGDDDQSIYAFRGANATYSLQFAEHFPSANIWKLQENYRSTEEILEMANSLICFNRNRYSKTLEPTKGSGPPVVVQDHPTVWAEADWVAQAVDKVRQKGIPGREIAVLFRVGQQAFLLQRSFQMAGIPHTLRGAGDFWQMAPARYLRGMLLIAAAGKVGAGSRMMGPGRRAEQFAKKALGVESRHFATQVKAMAEILEDKPPQSYGPDKVIDYQQRITAAADAAKSFKNAQELEAWVEQQRRALNRPDPNAVVLSTIHSAKGLEWHTVFLVGFEPGTLPHALAEGEEDEERRLAYVALSRAKRFLCLSFCHERYDEPTGASPFLAELLGDVPDSCFTWRGEGPLPTAGSYRVLCDASAKPLVSRKKRAAPKKKGPAKNGLPWTAGEDRRLLRWHHKGMNRNDIAHKLERSAASVKRRLDRLLAEQAEVPEEDPCVQWRDHLLEEALARLSHEDAMSWLNQPLDKEGHSPWQMAKTQKGYKQALKALKKVLL